jgi:hypothetical protein
MDLTTILVIVNLSFQVLERIFTYSYKVINIQNFIVNVWEIN